jgi:outer membrane protein assembly factor BamB
MRKLLLLLNFWILIFYLSGQNSWTHFRGDHLDGQAKGHSYPVMFGEEQNVVWKTEISGLAWSSPVVLGDQIWITTATRNGDKLSALCLDFETGDIVAEILLFEPGQVQNIHATNSFATPTPALEAGYIYVHYGTFGTACISTSDFSVVWMRSDMNCDHMQGPASSVVLHGDMLIVHIEGTDVQYIAALDKRTGKTIWKTHRPADLYRDIPPVYKKAYTTPIVVNLNGKDVLVSNGAQLCVAYDIQTGKELWSFWYGHDSTVGMPLVYGDIVYFNSGWIFEEDKAGYVKFFAVNPAGSGDITQTNLLWKLEEDIPQITTPVIADGRIYMVHERGTLTCVDALTGYVLWKERLKGQFNASPVYAGGYIYIPEVRGTVYIIKPGALYEPVGENRLEGTIKATPAFAGGNIILRTENNLYRIGNP